MWWWNFVLQPSSLEYVDDRDSLQPSSLEDVAAVPSVEVVCVLVGWWVSVGVPEVLLVVLWHEVGGRVGLQVARQARAARVVRRRWGSDSSNAAYTTAVGHIFMLEINEKIYFF